MEDVFASEKHKAKIVGAGKLQIEGSQQSSEGNGKPMEHSEDVLKVLDSYLFLFDVGVQAFDDQKFETEGK